jgi:hypothetical protein
MSTWSKLRFLPLPFYPERFYSFSNSTLETGAAILIEYKVAGVCYTNKKISFSQESQVFQVFSHVVVAPICWEALAV